MPRQAKTLIPINPIAEIQKFKSYLYRIEIVRPRFDKVRSEFFLSLGKTLSLPEAYSAMIQIS